MRPTRYWCKKVPKGRHSVHMIDEGDESTLVDISLSSRKAGSGLH